MFNKDRITVSSSTRRISQEQGLDIQDANAYIKVVDGESVACKSYTIFSKLALTLNKFSICYYNSTWNGEIRRCEH